MPYFKIDKVMQYTETVYIEADSLGEAEDKSGQEEGQVNNDDIWYDSNGYEISEEEYLTETT